MAKIGTLALTAPLRDSLYRRFGDIAFREKNTPETLPTGIPAINIPRGTLTEICGPPSSGRTSAIAGLFAHATRRLEFCALIDAGTHFDPLSAACAGVQLSHLLWLRCGGSTENALKAADLIVHAGGFGVVALDLAGISPRQARRISLASWFRLRHAVEKTPTAFLVMGNERYTSSCSTLQIETRSTGFKITDGLLCGLSVDALIGPRNRVKSAFALKPLYKE